MKILWVVNIPLPEVSLLMNETPSYLGGWLVNSSKDLADKKDIQLSVAFPKKNIRGYKKISGSKITYYAFRDIGNKDDVSIKDNGNLNYIINDCNPDIVHIYGTELTHSLSVLGICKKRNVKTVVSIQGLVHIIEKHISADLPFYVVYGATLRNLLKRDNIYGLKSLYTKRGKNEVEVLKNINNVIGRTTWDMACTKQINPNSIYYLCNETLRDEFYKYHWDINECEEYSMFVSQAQYPVKGLHYILEAMPQIIKQFPNAKLYVSGKDITKANTLKEKFLLTYYGKYIKKLIKKYNLENNIEFIGPLNEKDICKRFLKTHVFISGSTIENESNSLSEAKLLGVPSVASYVGGVIDRIKHNVDGYLYQHNAPYMLAYYVCNIFSNTEIALQFSEKSREDALERHNRTKNTNTLIKIYKDILQ